MMNISYRQRINEEVALNKEIARQALEEMDVLLQCLSYALSIDDKKHIDYYKKSLNEIRDILYDVNYFR